MFSSRLLAQPGPNPTYHRNPALTHAPTHPPGTPHQVPELVKDYMAGETMLDKYITHKLPFERINEAFEQLHSGQTLRTVRTFE